MIGTVRTVALAGVLVAACTTSARTVAVDAPAFAEPEVFVEADPVEASEQLEDPIVPGIGAGDCPAEVGDYPEVYFGDRVLIRLPKSVTSDELIEERPNRARLTRPVELLGCGLQDTPAPILQTMTLELRAPDPGGRIELIRNDALSIRGLLGAATLVAAEVDEKGHEGDWVYALPVSPERPQEANLLVCVRRSGAAVVVAMFETAAVDWPIVINSLRDSADRILLIPG